MMHISTEVIQKFTYKYGLGDKLRRGILTTHNSLLFLSHSKKLIQMQGRNGCGGGKHYYRDSL